MIVSKIWALKDSKIILNLLSVDKAEFKIISEKGLHLVFPKKNKWDWSVDEKWLRSIIVDDSGLVVSCSWKKFGNFGEFLDETNALKNELANGGIVRFTQKHDGSLCIRSVINGQVILRTRGTMFGGESDDGSETYGEKFRRVATVKYPKLLDSSWMSNVSLLLEYVAPDNAIVVKYKEEDLVFLGGIEHDCLRIISWNEVIRIANEGNLRLVELCELPSNPTELLENVKEWHTEGVVVRCCDDQIFVKVKSAWYLANHRMKYSMTYESIVEFCERSNIFDEEMLITKLREYDYDFEIIESAKTFYHQYKTTKNQISNMRNTAEELYHKTIQNITYTEEVIKRKYFAMSACAQIPFVKTMMFLFYDGKMERLNALMRKLILKMRIQ